MTDTEHSEKWYYDACTLDHNLNTITEIINGNHVSYISHLVFGEAYAGYYNKGVESTNYFIELIEKLRKYIIIVGNDGIEESLDEIRELCPMLSITDRVHLATALGHRCCRFRTTDNDFKSVTKDICKKLGNIKNIPDFAISIMEIKDKKLLFQQKKIFNRFGKR